MKEKQPKQHAGVWLDGHHATIIANAPGNETGDFVVEERVDSAENLNNGNEHNYNNTKQADTLHYFKSIARKLLSYDEILLFGPGKAQEQFHNFLDSDNHFKDKKITVDSSDKLSDAQMVHKVKDFFAPHSF
jgi:stalled ribosome rescue protein Dom34